MGNTLSESAEPYAGVVNLINVYIEQYNMLLSGRAGKTPVVPTPPITDAVA